jgi:hypothetical protein
MSTARKTPAAKGTRSSKKAAKKAASKKAAAKKVASKKKAPKKAVTKKAATKKAATKKAATRKSAAKKKPAKKKPSKNKAASPKKIAKGLRGAALAEAVIAHLQGPGSPIGEPIPLSPDQIARCEEAMGVALSPFMYALFSFDVGWIAREVGLFGDGEEALVKNCFEVIAEHAGVFADAYDPWCAARFTGKAAQLDAGSDSMRFLYLGGPDEHGEYPVLGIDHDDLPVLCVEYAGFDLWVASALDLLDARWDGATKEVSRRLLGSAEAWEMGPVDYPDFDALPPLAPAPAPGSIARAPRAPAPLGEPKKKMTADQLAKALRESARAGRIERLAALLADARERGLRGKAIDEALVEACLGKQRECMRALIAAGASTAARDYYGGALCRLVTYGGDVELVRMLLDAGFSPDSPGVNGETVIFEAVERGDEAITRLLIERGADVNHRAQNELTPLHEAVTEQKDPRFVDILCEAGALPDPCRKQSHPLYWAAQEASLEHVRRLLARGADPTLPSGHEKGTPLHAAYAFGRDDVAAALVQGGADRRAKDATGLSFERVYGPDGADIRPITVRFAPSAEPQVLTVTLEIAVTNRYQAGTAVFPALDAAHWRHLVLSGAAAEGLFPPESSRAEVLTNADRSSFAEGGAHRISFSLSVRGVAPGFVHWMCLSLLGGTRVFTGLGMESTLRIAALDAQGSRPGGETLDAAGLRSSLGPPGTWPEPSAFTLVQRSGDEAAIVVTTEKKAPKPFQEDLQQALQTWTALMQRVPTEVEIAPGKFALMAITQPDSGKAVLVNLLGGLKAGPLSLPWPREAALAQLGQVMRVLHAKVPLAKVELILPA